MKALKIANYFNLFEEHEIAHISLERVKGKVCVDGIVYPLYGGRTSEESKKVGLLLSETGDLLVQDYLVRDKEIER